MRLHPLLSANPTAHRRGATPPCLRLRDIANAPVGRCGVPCTVQPSAAALALQLRYSARSPDCPDAYTQTDNPQRRPRKTGVAIALPEPSVQWTQSRCPCCEYTAQPLEESEAPHSASLHLRKHERDPEAHTPTGRTQRFHSGFVMPLAVMGGASAPPKPPLNHCSAVSRQLTEEAPVLRSPPPRTQPPFRAVRASQQLHFSRLPLQLRCATSAYRSHRRKP